MLKALAVLLVDALAGTEAANFRSLPEPYGHTAQISPHQPNSDREWYEEYRWKPGHEYKAQDGKITVKPEHAPIPKTTPTFKRGKPLNKKPNRTVDVESNETKAKVVYKAPNATIKNTTVPAKPLEEIPCPSNSTKDSNGTCVKIVKAQPNKPEPVPVAQAVKTEPSYVVPKPCGHTSMVHPFNSNHDREWYTEYRWKPEDHYKPQDGPITEKPKTAMRGVTHNEIGDPCVPIKS